MTTYEEWDECQTCNGAGKIDDGVSFDARCFSCQGHGSKRYIRCSECDSTGECPLCSGVGCEDCKQTGVCECRTDRRTTEPRTIKGPCFDCDVGDAFGCVCQFFPGSDLACPCHGSGSVRDTKPNPKIEPDELRPNVPPRMM